MGGQAKDGEVVALRRAAGENDLVRLRRDDGCHLFTGAVHALLRDLAVAMGTAASVAELVDHEAHDLVRDPRIDGVVAL